MKKHLLLTIAGICLLFTSCTKNSKSKKSEISENKITVTAPSIAVFAPGILADSPIYAMLAEGVKDAVDSYNLDKADSEKASVYILEAGTNQAEWSSKITSLAAQKKYDVIISSNPSLPDLVLPLTERFPEQKFILLDAEYAGNENIFTVCYNQYEQAYLTGYLGGLMSESHKLALIAAQEYPVMNNVIYPYFEKGAKDADSKSSVDFRIVGNWYDANKASALADSVIANGVDVLLPICGGAAQGVINSAVNAGAKVTWVDNNGFSRAPGTIISSTLLKQREMSAIVTENYLSGLTFWGKADMVGIADHFVEFVQDDPEYIKAVPEKIRNKMANLIQSIIDGKTIIK